MSPYNEEPDAPLDITVRWLAAVTADLRHVLAEIDRLVREVAEDWCDDRGREWCERVGLLEHELARQVESGDELARTVQRMAADQGEAPGPRLGGTDGAQVGEGYGPRISTLPPPR